MVDTGVHRSSPTNMSINDGCRSYSAPVHLFFLFITSSISLMIRLSSVDIVFQRLRRYPCSAVSAIADSSSSAKNCDNVIPNPLQMHAIVATDGLLVLEKRFLIVCQCKPEAFARAYIVKFRSFIRASRRSGTFTLITTH